MSSATAMRAGIGPKGLPRKSVSRPAMMTLTPLLASFCTTSTIVASKNCASSMPTTSTSLEISSMLAGESIGVEGMLCESCETTRSSEYLTSMHGL